MRDTNRIGNKVTILTLNTHRRPRLLSEKRSGSVLDDLFSLKGRAANWVRFGANGTRTLVGGSISTYENFAEAFRASSMPIVRQSSRITRNTKTDAALPIRFVCFERMIGSGRAEQLIHSNDDALVPK
jgi:hypothetical protein